MILLDPDLDSHPPPKTASAKHIPASPSISSSKTSNREFKLPSARTLARFLAAAQAAVRLRGQVTVLLTTDESIRGLNRRFRGKNKATDVLSFPAEGLGTEGLAGDLAISVTTALSQAAEQGHSLSTEIKVLILHGLLHLAGYDHEIDNGKMARRERVLRAKLKLPQGLIERTTVSMSPSLKGHDFSRATKSSPKASALAAEGRLGAKKSTPRGRKPNNPVSIRAARDPEGTPPSPFKTGVKNKIAARAKRP
jgi:probable rRNA maturation factor